MGWQNLRPFDPCAHAQALAVSGSDPPDRHRVVVDLLRPLLGALDAPCPLRVRGRGPPAAVARKILQTRQASLRKSGSTLPQSLHCIVHDADLRVSGEAPFLVRPDRSGR